MDTLDINTIKAMPKEELDALNRKLHRKIATHVVGMVCLKLSLIYIARTLTKKALIAAAKHA